MQTIVVSTGSSVAEVWTAVFTGIGAVGTVGALLLAIKLWRDDRGKDRKAQASRIHGYKDGDVCIVENNSAGAVYDVEIPRTTLPVYVLAEIIPSGSNAAAAVGDTGTGQQGKKIPITFSFIDQDGVLWTRYRDDGLIEGKKP